MKTYYELKDLRHLENVFITQAIIKVYPSCSRLIMSSNT